ncbi:tun [Scenedesmus sp. PABB004]|nr:tun [Scenedesmus sp. PABB004]
MWGSIGLNSQRLRNGLKKYGRSGIVTYLGLSSCVTAGFYVAIERNVDVKKLVGITDDPDPDAEPSLMQKLLLGPGSHFALAVLCSKACIPIKLPVALALTPYVHSRAQLIPALRGGIMAAALAPATEPALGLDRGDCAHTRCYCEENVALLLRRLEAHGGRRGALYAAVVSNAADAIPLWRQAAGDEGQGGFIVWDYHVLALEVSRGGAPPARGPAAATRVWDLDSQLPFPCDAPRYAAEALQAGRVALPRHLARRWRVVAAATFLAHFASDRSHMRRPDGSWAAPPPPHACLRGPSAPSGHTLPRFRCMASDRLDSGAGGAASAGSDSGDDGSAGGGDSGGDCGRAAARLAGAKLAAEVERRAAECPYGVVLSEAQLLEWLVGAAERP